VRFSEEVYVYWNYVYRCYASTRLADERYSAPLSSRHLMSATISLPQDLGIAQPASRRLHR
jgi:hypothetical protein